MLDVAMSARSAGLNAPAILATAGLVSKLLEARPLVAAHPTLQTSRTVR